MSVRFSAKVEEDAQKRAAGCCEGEGCGGLLKPGQFRFHHIKPRWKGGGNSLENCKVLCTACHLAADEDHDFDNMRKADKKGKATEKLPVAAGMSEIARRFRIK